MPDSISALTFAQAGDPAEVLQLSTLPRPTPGPGEVLLRMLAAPINPSDVLMIEGRYGIQPPLPARAGIEGVGIVEAVGSGLYGRVLLGRRVAIVSPHAGTWGQYCVAPAKLAIPVPSQLSNERAASYFVNPASAYLLCRDTFKLRDGDWLLQSAAGSALGRMLIKLGQRLKFRTVNVVRRAEQADELRRLGADHVIVADENTNPEHFREQVKSACGAHPLAAIDPVGGRTTALLLQALGEGGKLVVYGSLTEEPAPVLPRDVIVRDLHIESFWLGRVVARRSLPGKIRLLRALSKLHRAGVFNVGEQRTFAIHSYAAAFAAHRSRHGAEKIVFLP